MQISSNVSKTALLSILYDVVLFDSWPVTLSKYFSIPWGGVTSWQSFHCQELFNWMDAKSLDSYQLCDDVSKWCFLNIMMWSQTIFDSNHSPCHISFIDLRQHALVFVLSSNFFWPPLLLALSSCTFLISSLRCIFTYNRKRWWLASHSLMPSHLLPSVGCFIGILCILFSHNIADVIDILVS